MARAPSGEYITVQVRRVWIAARPDNRTALVLDLVGMETIAIELDLEKIEILRQQLADAELFLTQQPGTA